MVLQAALAELAARIDAALPQTQCTRCGYADCRAYATAIAGAGAPINRCPPGGAEGVLRLSAVTGRAPIPLDPACGAEGPLRLARIDEERCIGCTLCIKACPVDAIVGAARRMHTVIAGECTGCELCLPACPVDCIELVVAQPQLSGWAAVGPDLAARARERHERRSRRLADAARAQRENPSAAPRQSVLDAALARARTRVAPSRIDDPDEVIVHFGDDRPSRSG